MAPLSRVTTVTDRGSKAQMYRVAVLDGPDARQEEKTAITIFVYKILINENKNKKRENVVKGIQKAYFNGNLRMRLRFFSTSQQ